MSESVSETAPESSEVPSWPEQTLRWHDIPGNRYTSKEFAEQEWENMWTRVWAVAGPRIRIAGARRLAA